LKTVQIPDNISDTSLALIRGVMRETLKSLPDHIFTGLRTKASISINSSATFEKNQREYGTLAAVQEFCKAKMDGERAMKYCLTTGKPDGYLDEDCTPGEYVFWRSLETLLWLTPEERRDAALAVVDEPGKSRAITKTRACVKIVLDLVNKICAVPLAKGFDSSSSGMKASHHAWNLFKDFETKSYEDILFETLSSSEEPFADYSLITKVYAHVYITSTDYETATDFLSHRVAKEIGMAWMHKCGIPKLLRQLVCEVAYGPRSIRFYGNIGMGKRISEEEDLFCINTCRGVLMGDPLTKIVLHFTNICARQIAQLIRSGKITAIAFDTDSIMADAALQQILDLA